MKLQQRGVRVNGNRKENNPSSNEVKRKLQGIKKKCMATKDPVTYVSVAKVCLSIDP